MNTYKTLYEKDNRNLPKEVEEEFESAREAYLKELSQLRNKYKRTLNGLTMKYALACNIQMQRDRRVIK